VSQTPTPIPPLGKQAKIKTLYLVYSKYSFYQDCQHLNIENSDIEPGIFHFLWRKSAYSDPFRLLKPDLGEEIASAVGVQREGICQRATHRHPKAWRADVRRDAKPQWEGSKSSFQPFLYENTDREVRSVRLLRRIRKALRSSVTIKTIAAMILFLTISAPFTSP
jgi:hypothetical protein